jgi:putative protein-disulfide isomerase
MYLFDPLCGWCYGTAPVIERILARPDFALLLQPAGIFAGEGAFPMNAGFAAHAWAADQRIAQLSGQTFSESYRSNVLENGAGKIVDSGPATLALTAVRLTQPDREFSALKAIQAARYVEGRDNGSPDVIGEVLTELGLLDARERFTSPDAELQTANRAQIDAARSAMRRLGARGVPVLAMDHGQGVFALPTEALYGDFEALLTMLRPR